MLKLRGAAVVDATVDVEQQLRRFPATDLRREQKRAPAGPIVDVIDVFV